MWEKRRKAHGRYKKLSYAASYEDKVNERDSHRFYFNEQRYLSKSKIEYLYRSGN